MYVDTVSGPHPCQESGRSLSRRHHPVGREEIVQGHLLIADFRATSSFCQAPMPHERKRALIMLGELNAAHPRTNVGITLNSRTVYHFVTCSIFPSVGITPSNG